MNDREINGREINRQREKVDREIHRLDLSLPLPHFVFYWPLSPAIDWNQTTCWHVPLSNVKAVRSTTRTAQHSALQHDQIIFKTLFKVTCVFTFIRYCPTADYVNSPSVYSGGMSCTNCFEARLMLICRRASKSLCHKKHLTFLLPPNHGHKFIPLL